MSEAVRINKYLSENGYCSRREADRLIQSGGVFINGRKAELGDKVSDSDVVRVLGRDKKKAPVYTYLLVNKPPGLNVSHLVDYGEGVFPVGDLDPECEGLVLLTNDRTLANRIELQRYEDEKEYVVTVNRPLSSIDIGKLQNGVHLKGGVTLPAQVRKLDERRFAIIMREAREHEIERMCEVLGCDAISIKRTRILSLKMPSTYPAGEWRYLTELEVEQLKKAAGIEQKQTNFKLHKR